MEDSLSIFVDGSRVLADDRSCQALGWAAVGCHGDELLEERGAFLRPCKGSALGGYHEHVAFVQGVLLAHRLGVAFDKLSITCDDDVFGYAPTWLHPQNYFGTRRDQVFERLRLTVRYFFEPSAFELTVRAFEQARIHKVKGHSQQVYQERADYLARFEARSACAGIQRPPLKFHNWLRKGIKHYSRDEERLTTWHAPFVQPFVRRTAAQPGTTPPAVEA